jgi:hypothetical protein
MAAYRATSECGCKSGRSGRKSAVMEARRTSEPAPPDVAQIASVGRALKKAAYFPLFSVHNSERRNVPMPSAANPNNLIGMQVFEELHQFRMDVERPFCPLGLRASNHLGAAVAQVEIDWRVIPDTFVANPDQLPPATDLDPTRSQRFAMYNGKFTWLDRDQSAFHGFGAGRTFPAMVNDAPRLYIAAVVEILQGFGKLKGLQGNAVVNGFITPPYDVALNILLRVVDPSARLRSQSVLPPIRATGEADPSDTFLVFLGEPDSENPIMLDLEPDGRVVGADVHELLRLVHIDFDVVGAGGMRSVTMEGPVVGSLAFRLQFDSADPRVPTPFTTTDALFTFFDRERNSLGTLNANVVEGRGFATALQEVPQPVVRVVGFGPLLGGTGQFAGTEGMLSLNGIISIPARTPSIMYVLRVLDLEKRFRKIWK